MSLVVNVKTREMKRQEVGWGTAREIGFVSVGWKVRIGFYRNREAG